MEEIKEVLNDILIELQQMNEKLDTIMGTGVFNSLSDIYDKLGDIESSVDNLDI